MNKIDLFGIKFDNLTMEEAVEQIKGFVILPYSEFVVKAQKDEEFKKILNSADFCLCESGGLYLMARLIGKKLKENINGIDLIQKLSNSIQHTGNKIFLFGSKQEVVEKVAKKLGDCIIGFEHGYQDYEPVIQKINILKPEILLVGLGSPKQEKFIYFNLNKMPSVKLAIGVGGAFDFISGHVKRAPKIIQKIYLEWLWRLIVQPKRVKRIFIGVGGLLCLTIKNMLQLKRRNQKVAKITQH
jgi:N-acetylglucosaminyldiphosphoundecaprenol N-acetyl-beta-D-mannosaminyltransferase